MKPEEKQEVKPIEVTIKEKEKPKEEEPEDSQYYDDLELTKDDIEEFEKDGT